MAALNASDPPQEYFGTALTPCTFHEWLSSLDGVLGNRSRYLWGHHNLHSLYLLRRDTGVAAFYRRCDGCYIDGMPVRLIRAGFGQPLAGSPRFSLMDHFPALLERAEDRGWHLFYLGSAPAVVERARQRIARDYPRLHITVRHGYFADDKPVLAEINSLRPDLLLVGMGMPRQEHWLLRSLDELHVGCAVQAGATLDYFAGAQARPPLWLSRAGMAWLYRLARNPRRLWHRYLVEPWCLLRPTLRSWYRHRSSDTGPTS